MVRMKKKKKIRTSPNSKDETLYPAKSGYTGYGGYRMCDKL
jgi:hypothetical protein